jgi:hypothetical protein
MIVALLIALIILGLPTLYFAWRSRDFRKFLAGAFFVNAGIQFYFYLAKVSVPLLGTNLVVTPINGANDEVTILGAGIAIGNGGRASREQERSSQRADLLEWEALHLASAR